MQIVLIQSEIEEAIKAFVLTQMSVRPDASIEVDFRSTRGDSGIQAIIEVTSAPTKGKAKPKPVITTADLKRLQQEEASADTLEGAETETETDQSMAEEAIQEDAGEAEPEAAAPVQETVPVPSPQPSTPPRPVASVGPAGLRLNKAPAVQSQQGQPAGGSTSAPAKKLFAGFSKPNNPPGE